MSTTIILSLALGTALSAAANYTAHPGKNCYNGHGAVNIDTRNTVRDAGCRWMRPAGPQSVALVSYILMLHRRPAAPAAAHPGGPPQHCISY